MTRPAFQFYPADWRKDPALSACSLAARGLWIELVCIAHEADRYGHLSINDKPMTNQQIARMVGESPATVGKLVAELESAGVFSRAEDGSIYSRRMVADEHIRNVRAEAGRLGGNPNLLKQKDKQKVKQTDKQSPTPSSSSSSSIPSVSPDGLTGADGADPPAKSAAELTKDELWSAGKSLLSEAGLPSRQCGSFVGKLVKDYGNDIVIDAVRSAVVERPADPVEYLKAVCMRSAGQRAQPNRQEAQESRNRAVASDWLQQQEVHA